MVDLNKYSIHSYVDTLPVIENANGTYVACGVTWWNSSRTSVHFTSEASQLQ